MTYYTIAPSQKLKDYVRFFWVFEGEGSAFEPYIYRSLADGCAELLFHYNGQFDELISEGKVAKSFLSGIHGQSHKFRRFFINQNFGIFGAYLYPFAIPKLFSFPSTDFRNKMPDLDSLLGKEGKELEEKMMTAKDNLQRLKILTFFLEKQLDKSIKKELPGVFLSISHIIKNKGTTNIKDLSKQYFLSTRQFERKFKELSGFGPKLFSRIIRFQSAVNQYNNKNKSLTEIAYECGYYDQSHFIQDFKEFSGYNPKEYFSGNAEGIEWQEV